MAVSAMSWVWEQSPYDGAMLLIHLALADFANAEGKCWPTQTSLAQRARCSVRWVQSAVKQMKDDGLLVVEEQGDGRGHSNVYRLVRKGELSSPFDFGKDEPQFQKGRTLTRERTNPTSSQPNKNHHEPRGVVDRVARECPLGQCGGSFVVEVNGLAEQCRCVVL